MTGKTSISLLIVASLNGAVREEFDYPPISYASSKPDNAVSRPQTKLDAGPTKLSFSDNFGYHPALLKELSIPVSPQMLVFSRTSLQRDRISPRTPRALYFNDDVYVGFCRLGEVLEIAVTDPQLGTVFYTLVQETTKKPKFIPQTDNSLVCHLSRSEGVPALVVRSVYTDTEGQPLFSGGLFRTDQKSLDGQN